MCATPQTFAFRFEPAVELGRHRNVKTGKQISLIERKRFLQLARIQRRLEFIDVAPYGNLVHRHVITARDDYIVAKFMTEKGEGDAESRSGVLIVRLWPEQRNQRVPPVEAARVRKHKVGEKGEALGLCDYPGRRTPLMRSQLD